MGFVSTSAVVVSLTNLKNQLHNNIFTASFLSSILLKDPIFLYLRVNEQFRRNLTWKAFPHVASYDSAVSEWLWKQTEGGSKQALISLSDKKDLALLANGLQELGYKIVSTASSLESNGVSVTRVMLDGRVKTLHPNIHGGILARRDQSHHMEALDKHGIGTFDVVIVNLYPFYDTVSSTNQISFEDGIEKIDIGGPAMIRAATKNHKDVLVVVDSKDYHELLESLRANRVNEQFRRKLAWKAFLHVASYDSAVSEWLW